MGFTAWDLSAEGLFLREGTCLCLRSGCGSQESWHLSPVCEMGSRSRRAVCSREPVLKAREVLAGERNSLACLEAQFRPQQHRKGCGDMVTHTRTAIL